MSFKSIKYPPFFFVLLILFACEKSALTNSAISAAHPLATNAGLTMYEQGGNAFDAAVAAGFTLAVVEPSMSGLGGRLQAIYNKSNGSIAGIDASTEVPMNYSQNEEKISYGYPTIGIPGVVAGLLALHESKGELPLSKVLAPAIEHASNGFKLLPGEAKRQQLAKDKLLEFEGTKHHFLVKDSLSYQAGDLVVQKDLARVLQTIADKGRAGFYEGEVAQKMVDDFQSNGGIVTLEDLKNYRALESKILKGSFREHEVHSLYLPSFGAITIQILQILDHLNPPKDEKEWAFQHAKATALAYTYRKKQTDSTQLEEILSYEKAADWAAKIEQESSSVDLPVEDVPISWTAIDGHTTHLTTADKWGNVVALTQTIGPNMGISKNGKIILALGAAGGSRIVPAITQVSDRYLTQQNTLAKALTLPRVYPYQDSIWVENHPGLQQSIKEPFYATLPIKYIDEPARFGRVHAIAKKGNSWVGAADPDWEGTTAYFPLSEKTKD